MDKYLANLIDQGADPHLIAKHAGIGVVKVQKVAASEPAETHGSITPAPRRRTRKKAEK